MAKRITLRRLQGIFQALLLVSLPFMMILSNQTAVWAQATNATIAGTVLDEHGSGLPGASVVVKNQATGFQTGTVTDVNGSYQQKQLPLGGPYAVTVSFIGYGQIKKLGYYLSQEDRIVADFELQSATQTLEEITISGESLQNRIEQLGASTKINANQIKNLPTEGRNFTRLTSLSPLQGGGSINLGGQRRTSTNVTIDGVNARNQLTAGEVGRGPYTISQEAIREFEVVTNDYDVTQGRQAGGSLNAVTKAGTNTFEGSAFFYHRADALQSQYDIRNRERTADFYNSQYGVSFGGPLIKDKLHIYTVFERQDAGEPVDVWDIRDRNDEIRRGISRENLDRFLTIARDQYGVSDEKQIGEFERETVANTWFVRLDWQINDKHTLTLRNNFNDWDRPFSTFDNVRAIAETGGNFGSQENSTLLSLRSAFSPKFTNEFKVQYQHAERAFTPNPQLPGANIPRATVTIETEGLRDDGRSSRANIQLGGQRFTPETNSENNLHFTNTAYLDLGKVNLTVGTDNMITFMETLLSNEQNGRFFYRSIEDFENNTPFRYQREVPLKGTPIVNQTVFDVSAFAQAEFNLSTHIQAAVGLRYDASIFTKAGDRNVLLEQELGLRSDRKPNDFNNIQPRMQLTWDIGGKGRDIVKLGAGLFSAQFHYYAQVVNIQNSGTRLGAIDINGDITGDGISDVPVPDFEAYRDNPSLAPGVELFEQLGIQPFSTINVVGDDFKTPTTYKANLNYSKIINDRFSVGINLLMSKTRNNYVYQEANLVDEPFFRIEEEGNRGVFVPAESISEDGSFSWLESRKSDRLGRVLELTSNGELDQWAIVFEGTAKIGKDGYLNASYTINRTQDNSSYNCCVANSSTLFLPVVDDPRALNYGYSDNHFDNKVVLNGATPTWKGFQLGLTVTGTGGTRYSLHAGGRNTDGVNGDFVGINDIAFVFDPNAPNTPVDIAEALTAIENDPEVDDNFKEYLRESYGGFAERNGGRNPFAAFVDMRLTKDIKIPGTNGQKLTFSADLFNVGNFFSDVVGSGVFGSDREEDNVWGRSRNYSRRTLRDRALFAPTGFNVDQQRYEYRVNSSGTVSPINGTPWRLQLGVRYSFN